MFLLLNSFLLIFSLYCGSCYNIEPEDDPVQITTINTKVNFLHEAINLPAGVPEEDLNKIKETIYTYNNYFMEIEKGVEYCKFDKQKNNCTTKLEGLKQNLLNEIQMLERQKRTKSQFSFKPNFSKCFICMGLFVNRMRKILDDYVVHFKLVFMIDKNGDATDAIIPSTGPENSPNAPEKPTTAPEKPPTDPEKPPTGPEKPTTGPEKPPTGPEMPPTGPVNMPTDPENPTADS